MAQTNLAFGPAYEGRQAWEKQLEVLRAAVSYLVAKEVSDQLDTNRSTLSEALNEQRDRKWANEWTHVIKAMLAAKQHDDPVAADLLRRICQADMAAAPSVTTIEMTDEEREEVECFLETRRKRKSRKRLT